MTDMSLDLNEAWPPEMNQPRFDLEGITAALRVTARHWVPRLFPNGRREGDEWRLANIRGDAPRKSGSCVIALSGPNAGDWHDFETGNGGGPIDTIGQATGLFGRALFAKAADIAGHGTPLPPTSVPKPVKRSASVEMRFIRDHARDLRGTHGEAYLQARGLPLPETSDLLFHPDLTHWDSKRGFPALVGLVRDVLANVIGLHRTYIDPDAPKKAEIKKSKMMLGKVTGGAVRLRHREAASELILCEGIESGLALLRVTPPHPVWAALSSKGLETISLPETIQSVTIFADHDESGTGLRAALRLSRRLKAEGRKVRIALPPDADTDANDILHIKGLCALQAAFDTEWREPEPPDIEPAEAANEDAIADAFSRRHAHHLRYDHHRGRWYIWDDAHWKHEETGLALHWAREECRRAVESQMLGDNDAAKLLRAGTAASVVRFAQSDRRHAVTSAIWDPDQFVLGTPGGTVDLRTGDLRPAERADYITRLTAVAPSLAADCPTWRGFLDDATQGDAGLVRFLQQIAGYCLTGDTREHALFFIYGPGGNGKSVFLNTLNGILAAYAETAVMDAFTASAHDKHSTDIAMLQGARLVSVSETEEGRAWAETRVKQLTGGDKVTARFMRQDNFTFIPRFKLVIVGNHKPVLTNVDDAAKRRFNIIPFTRKPPRPDKELEVRLRTEWPGILRWMIEGCLDWQEHGLVRPAIVSDATAEYFDDQDTFGQWLEECCLLDKREFETTAKLFQSWKAFAERQGDRPGTAKAFGANLTRRGFEADRTRLSGSQHRVYRGLSLRFDPAASGINHD